MGIIKRTFITAAAAAFIIAAIALPAAAFVRQETDLQAPELPAGCSQLAAPAGHRAFFKTYALGVQIYRWNGASWAFVGPRANLYADASFHGQIGTHYAGPTWESVSGSRVIGARDGDCQPNPTAIPWLRLRATTAEGPGVFAQVTYIQRVNTAGGLAPTAPGVFVGEEARVPYTTEYYFYKAE